jgi:uncharacterized iron-regulated membrane protein
MTLRTNLRRWHVWLGWLVGVPLLLWTLSGFVMVLKPIEEVRGAELLAAPVAVQLTSPPVLPSEVSGLPLAGVRLEQRASGPRWIIELAGGPARLGDPATGRLLGPVSAADAAAEVVSRWQGKGGIAAVTRTSADAPPLDLRRPVATWQVRMEDGTHIYVDATTGSILATRTRWWRVYDVMWGLHIMDLSGREDTHHPLLLGFAGLSMLALLLSLILLPLSSRRRRA